MPNFFVHLYFGRLVFQALPAPLQRAAEREKGAYLLGQFGPDPLFFYRLGRSSRAARLGRQMHRQPVSVLLPAVYQAAAGEEPFALSYGTGFLCHFALDSRCHGYVKERAGDSRLLHTAIESEFDRFLMARLHLDPTRETPMPEACMSAAFYETLSRRFYPGVEEDGYREGLAVYKRLCVWHTKCAARSVIPLGLAAAAKRWPSAALVRDVALKCPPGPAFEEYNRRLLALLEGEVQPAAEQIAAFFQTGQPTPWFRRDFYGGVSSDQ
ncbi:MAG: zinc dependent phospholipase C family protein [Oscillospiraceae bacterium]|nr:zinc dependent phospholipase C family protein [Oscillospiraceae bacterium]